MWPPWGSLYQIEAPVPFLPIMCPADPIDWRPTAGPTALQARARVLARIREFFAERGVLEVDTPTLSPACSSEPHLQSLATRYRGPGAPPEGQMFLHTSPEFAMKRLLAAGSGPIYQIAKVFRDGEAGRLHNPEFTLLEWYQPGMDHLRLMDEVAELVFAAYAGERALAGMERVTYREAFLNCTGLDPFAASLDTLRHYAQVEGLAPAAPVSERDFWLDLILTQRVEPHLGGGRLSFLYDYPPSQASLARIRREGQPVAERFELYLEGIELANGFHELRDSEEQERRFRNDALRRRELGLAEAIIDVRLLAALHAGLPACAGVALGIDRLVMLLVGANSIREVIAFPVDRA